MMTPPPLTLTPCYLYFHHKDIRWWHPFFTVILLLKAHSLMTSLTVLNVLLFSFLMLRHPLINEFHLCYWHPVTRHELTLSHCNILVLIYINSRQPWSPSLSINTILLFTDNCWFTSTCHWHPPVSNINDVQTKVNDHPPVIYYRLPEED